MKWYSAHFNPADSFDSVSQLIPYEVKLLFYFEDSNRFEVGALENITRDKFGLKVEFINDDGHSVRPSHFAFLERP